MILYLSDIHFKESSPAARQDDFPASLENKFRAVFRLIRSRGVSAVLFGGDLFDHWGPRFSEYIRMARAIQSMGVPWYVVAGNHDLRAGNFNSLVETALGAMIRTGVVKILTDKWTLVEGMAVTGYSYDPGIEGRLRDKPLDDDAHITLIHAMITERPFHDRFLLVREVQCSARFLLCSHYHPGFPIAEFKRTLFVGPGAFSRLSYPERNRQVQVALIDVEDDRAEYVPVPMVSAEDCFGEQAPVNPSLPLVDNREGEGEGEMDLLAELRRVWESHQGSEEVWNEVRRLLEG